jgi:hypothetical protein
MKTHRTFVILAGLLFSSMVFAEGGGKTAPPQKGGKAGPSPEAVAMAAAMEKYSMPRKEHEMLKAMAGSWTTTMRAWTGPGQPTESVGSAESKLILDGRFLQEDYSGTFFGRKFVGHGLTGFDLGKGRYVSTWADNLGTWFTTTEGSLDASGKVLTMTGENFNPAIGKNSPSKMVTRIESERRHVFEVYDKMDGKDVKVMEIVYNRK